MDELAAPHPEAKQAAEFVTKFDGVPGFWNFLVGLNRDDLIAELIQNDLDEGATKTVLSFERTLLVCEGNGAPVSADGWKRLCTIQGAGDEVPAKRRKIGIKNHGLKAAFTIGDEIRVLSDGLGISQTLYARGPTKAPYPGASPAPKPDTDAPKLGCRVEIVYRRAKLEPREGEAILLGPTTPHAIESLFKSSCMAIPEQFIGIVSPKRTRRYEIVLRHWSLGEVRFVFSCTRTKSVSKNIELFRRRCEVIGSVETLHPGLKEEAARRLVRLKGRLKDRLPDFYRHGNRFSVEVSWPIESRSKPRSGIGRFRYPIGYPEASHESRTGHGFYFSAPIVSDSERHGPARNDQTNQELRLTCERLLLDVVTRYLVPRWGPDAMKLLIPGDADGENTVRKLLGALAKQGGIPILNWRDALGFLLKNTRRKHMRLPKRVRTQSKKYQFVIPTWDRTSIHPSLAIIAPPHEKQIDPRINSRVISIIADEGTNGWLETFITFDKNDAVARLTGTGNVYFPASTARERELAHPLVSSAYLNVIAEMLNEKTLDHIKELKVQATLLLADSNGLASPFQELHVSAPLPSNIPGLRLPHILHSRIATHPIFRRKNWRREKYDLAKFLASGELQSADEATRRQFWDWLQRNPHHIGRPERIILAGIDIWPDTRGNLGKLVEFCDPHSRAVAAVLGDSIRTPHEQVQRFALVGKTSHGRSLIRRVPTSDELIAWLARKLSQFTIGQIADSETAAALKRVEGELALLLKDRAGARLKELPIALPALAQDGSIRLRSSLVVPSGNIARVSLPERFLLANARDAATLNKLLAALVEPTAEMLIAAFEENSRDFTALQARLQKFLALTNAGDAQRQRVSSMEIIPLHGDCRAPNEIAFSGPKGDFWGNWKARLSGKGLSQDSQRRYVDVGVTRAAPTVETSRAFFAWLSQQDASVLKYHVACVLRHMLHIHGPQDWAKIYTDIPCIPVRGREDLCLISLQAIRQRLVLIPDAREIAEQVINADSGVFLVIDRVQEVTNPVAEIYKSLGIGSLREMMGEPDHVIGIGEVQEETGNLKKALDVLHSSNFRATLRKRLNELGVESELIRHDWHDRVAQIGTVVIADQVQVNYRFRGKLYQTTANAGFDPASRKFWIKRQSRSFSSAFYEGIAAQLVFKPSARPVDLLALERSLEVEIQDRSYGRPTSAQEITEENVDVGAEPDDAEGETGEAIFGHSPFNPDPERNRPQPGNFPTTVAQPSRSEVQRTSRGHRNDDKTHHRESPEIETKQIEHLKSKEYASHCQVCLCLRAPEVLAPEGSYVEWEEVRRKVIEAHHLDPVSGGGARHAGNLVLLCKLHHDNYGRRLTRDVITAALHHGKREIVSFRGNDPVTEVAGLMIDVSIPDTGEIVAIFFTDEHAEYWLSDKRRSK